MFANSFNLKVEECYYDLRLHVPVTCIYWISSFQALSFAANSGHSYAAKVLLENKALKTLCAYDGQTPADIAYAKGFTTVGYLIFFDALY